MNGINFSENIIKLRHHKGITQAELADFVGVTKASVSKWETKQSLPDLLILPQLAAFFDVTLDDLLGYQPQLSKEQIQKKYFDLTAEFAELPFEQVLKKSEDLVRRYYSCYPLLLQISVLWLNHFMLAADQGRQLEVLGKIADLCSRILSECEDIALCNQAIILKSTVDLQAGKGAEVIEALEEILDPYRLFGQGEQILISAYQMVGEIEKASQANQFSMYQHLLNLLSSSTQYLTIHPNNHEICDETIRRMDELIATFKLAKLHPNVVAQFQYQAAVVYCMQQKAEKALQRIQLFVTNVEELLLGDFGFLHGDQYFDSLDEYFVNSDLGVTLLRDKKVIWNGVIQALENPVFTLLASEESFQKIKKSMKEKGER